MIVAMRRAVGVCMRVPVLFVIVIVVGILVIVRVNVLGPVGVGMGMHVLFVHGQEFTTIAGGPSNVARLRKPLITSGAGAKLRKIR